MLKILVFLLLISLSANVFVRTDADKSATAKAFIDALSREDFKSAYDLFSDETKEKVSAAMLRQIWSQITGEYGKFRSLKELRNATDGKNLVAVIEFERKSESFLLAFNSQGKILGFTLAPPSAQSAGKISEYETPAYANPNSFEESEVSVGSGKWALPATLTMPKGKTDVPAIVLVHGSGPNDRDETHLNPANKIFKDLAWGLASQGFAVLRYEKRTKQYGAKLASVKDFTVNDETVDDALFAVRELRQTSNVGAKKIFVLGHSLGGMMIPRIGRKDKNIAGFIVFAGATRHLEDAIVEQITYFANLNGAVSTEEQAQIDEYKRIAVKIKSLTEADRASGAFYFGAYSPYYLDLQNYDAPQSAKLLKQPMLILQGESDYQVTMTDFANWKNALAARKNVTFKTYPNLTHTFMESAGGKPSPKDYEKTAHVSRQVVSDIADWILKS